MTTQELSLPKDQNLPVIKLVKILSSIKMGLLESHIRYVLVNVSASLRDASLDFIDKNGISNFIMLIFNDKFNPSIFCGTSENSDMSIRAFKGNIAESIIFLKNLDVSEYENLGHISEGHVLKRAFPTNFGEVIFKPLTKPQKVQIKNYITFLFTQLSSRTYQGTYPKFTKYKLEMFLDDIYYHNFNLSYERNMSAKSEFEFEGFRRELLVYLRKIKVVA